MSPGAPDAALIRALHETLERTPIRLCALCVMSNHWHLVLWPEGQSAAEQRRDAVANSRPHRRLRLSNGRVVS